MKKYLYLLFFTLAFGSKLYGQSALVKQWDYRFGGTGIENVKCIQETNDGGYIIGGSSFSNIGGDKTQANWDTSLASSDYWIVKTDSLGIKEWDLNFGGTEGDFLYSVQETTDGGYILGGYSISDIGGDKTQASKGNLDYWIVKTDSLGIKQWDKDFGGTNDDVLLTLQQTSDEGYIIGGWSVSGISGDKTQASWGSSDYWILKLDSMGNKQWDMDFGGTYEDNLICLQQTSDGGYIFGGTSNSDVSGNKTQANRDTIYPFTHDYWIVKTDSIGNIEWQKDFGGTMTDNLVSVQETSDSGFILGGNSDSGISGDKTQATWGNTDLLGGRSNSNASGDKTENNFGIEQTWIVKGDSLGNKQWDKTIFTNSHDEDALAVFTKDKCYTMANSSDGGIAGYKTQLSQGNYDYWIIKFCDTTSTTSMNQISNIENPFSIYPNPTNTLIHFFLLNSENLTITDVFGKVVLQKKVKGEVELDVSSLTAGIYFIRAGNAVRKFIKE